MGETMIAPPGPEEQPAGSFFDRALGVFISPSATFEDIVRKPGFIAPLIVAIVAAIALTECMMARIGMERIVRRAIELNPKASQMTPEQVEKAVHQGATIGSIFAWIFAVVGVPLLMLIFAAIGLFIVNVIFGGSAKFPACFAVTCYANLVSLIGVVLALVLIFFGDAEQFNPQNFIPSNVGFFLNPLQTPKALYTIATSFDVFTIWFLILLGIGLSRAAVKKIGPIAITLTYFGMWILWVLGKVAIGMMTG